MNENESDCTHAKVDTYTNRWVLLVTPGGAQCYACGARIHTRRRTRLFVGLAFAFYGGAMFVHPGLGTALVVPLVLFGMPWLLAQELDALQPQDKPRDLSSDSGTSRKPAGESEKLARP